MGLSTERAARSALHIDVMAGDRCVADHIFTRRHISVGRSRSNDVQISDELAPWSLPLFHRGRGGWMLHYDDRTQGQVAASESAPQKDLSELHGLAAEHGGGHDLPLLEGAHGRIQLGDDVLEFESIAALPHPRRWAVMIGLVGVLLAAGLVAWALSLRAPPRLPPAPPPVRATILLPAPPAVAAPPEIRPLLLQPLTLRAATAGRPGAGGGAWMRAGGGLAAPGVGAMAPLPRGAERTIAPSDYTDEGLLRPEAVTRALLRDGGALRAIYDRELRRDPGLRGDLTVRILVARDGSVRRVTVFGDTLRSRAVSYQVASYLLRWRALAPMADEAEYEVPLHFRSQ